MGVHAGTHVDAPLHFIDDGKSVDELGSQFVYRVGSSGGCPRSQMIQPEHISQ